MKQALLLAVRLHDGRYHGERDGPPSPARLFQALVAATGIGGPLTPDVKEALRWLERLEPPTIASPSMTGGRSFKNFVPSNDLDAVGGDRRRIGKLRREKTISPMLFDADVPLLYIWTFEPSDEAEDHAAVIRGLADRLYQFGRGVDLAWAWAEELAEDELEGRLEVYRGVVYRPSNAGAGKKLPCPAPGTLTSLMRRHEAGAKRFRVAKAGRSVTQQFSQQPKARFRPVAYDSPPTRHLYELRERSPAARFTPWPLDRVVELVEAVRDGAKRRLQDALPEKNRDVERVIMGRKANGADDAPTSLRVRIVPLPSIGHRHVDHDIRRILVEVPAGCPLRADDVGWAFAGQAIGHPTSGEPIDLTPAEAGRMLENYGIDDDKPYYFWRSVTPVALPQSAARRRIDPARISEQAKGSEERREEQERAAAAVFQALRQARVRPRPVEIRVQREPFESNGQRVEPFARGTRFAKERLCHVEVRLTDSIRGPLVIGDGRFLGLGVMAPVRGGGVHWAGEVTV